MLHGCRDHSCNYFLTESHYVDQIRLKLMILLPRSSEGTMPGYHLASLVLTILQVCPILQAHDQSSRPRKGLKKRHQSLKKLSECRKCLCIWKWSPFLACTDLANTCSLRLDPRIFHLGDIKEFHSSQSYGKEPVWPSTRLIVCAAPPCFKGS